MIAPFKPPSSAEVTRALGDTTLPKEDPQLRRFLERCIKKEDPTLFTPIPLPGMNDWLANHREHGQTFDQWNDMSFRNDVDEDHHVIYLLPILEQEGDGGSASKDSDQFLQLLKTYAEAFFLGLEVILLPVILPKQMGCKTRVHEVISGVTREQILAGDVMAYIENNMPIDAYCMIGVTMCDLYPEESWNFVFGMASLQKRSGVFSFARYHPKFFDTGEDITIQSIYALPPDLLRLALRRSFDVLTHEITHMFGIRHCIYFSCLMNGSNHQEESDSRTMFLCPVCLRKLKNVVRFDVSKRYNELLRVLRSVDEQFPLCKESEKASTTKEDDDDKITEAVVWLNKVVAFINVDSSV